MSKIEVDSEGNVNGEVTIKNGDSVQFVADLKNHDSCELKVKFKTFSSKNEQNTEAASAGTIKIGS